MKSVLVLTTVLIFASISFPVQTWAQACEGGPTVCTKMKTVEACAKCVRDRGEAGQSGGYNYCRCWLAQRKKK